MNEDDHLCTLYEMARLFCLIDGGSAKLRRMLCDYADAADAGDAAAARLMNRMMRITGVRQVDQHEIDAVMPALRQLFEQVAAQMAGGDPDDAAEPELADVVKLEILRSWCDTPAGGSASESGPESQSARLVQCDLVA